MPAVTVDRERRHVFGNRRVITAQVDIAADADFYDTQLRRIESFSACSETNNAIGATFSTVNNQQRVAFQTGGAENNVLVEVVGY